MRMRAIESLPPPLRNTLIQGGIDMNNNRMERPGMQIGLMASGVSPTANPNEAPRFLFQPRFFPPVLM